MHGFKKRAFQLSNRMKELFYIFWLGIPTIRITDYRRSVPVIVSMTSYPGRIRTTWIALETLMRQTVKPQQIVLVLNEQEFPNRVIPKSLERRQRRGLEVLWVEKNGRSYDKLLPVRQTFPEATIVTCDDDKFFPPALIESLYEASQLNSNAVIGSRGWKINLSSDTSINYGVNWSRASAGYVGADILTPGGNGCLYPYDSLHPSVDSLDAAVKICPTADDIWFWSAALKNQTSFLCLGMPPHRPITTSRGAGALSALNITENDTQFQAALDYFEIRDFVLDAIAHRARTTDA